MQYIQDKSAFYRYIFENCHCVNAGQSPEERKVKYIIVKALTGSVTQARRKRDWTTSHIAISLGYSSWKKLIEMNTERIENVQ